MHVQPAWCTQSAGGRWRGMRWHPGARRHRAQARVVSRPARGPSAGPTTLPETCTTRSPLRGNPTASYGACPLTSLRPETIAEGSAPTRARVFTARTHGLSAWIGTGCCERSTWGRIAPDAGGSHPPCPRSTTGVKFPVVQGIVDRLLEHLHAAGWRVPHLASLHLHERGFRLGEPEGHVHRLVQREGCRQLAVGALRLPDRGSEQAQAPVAVGLERAQAQGFGQRQGLLVVGGGWRHLGGIGGGLDSTKLVQRLRLMAPLLILPRQGQGLASMLPGVVVASSEKASLAEPRAMVRMRVQGARADILPERLLQECTPLGEAACQGV